MLILGIQIANITYIFQFGSNYIGTPDKFLDPEIMNEFHMLRGHAYRFQYIMLLDCSTLFLCVTNLMTILRKVDKIDHILHSLKHSIAVVIRCYIIYFFLQQGLCLYNMAIYGGEELRYSTFLSANVATIYNQAATFPKDAVSFNVTGCMFTVINNLFNYFINIVL